MYNLSEVRQHMCCNQLTVFLVVVVKVVGDVVVEGTVAEEVVIEP